LFKEDVQFSDAVLKAFEMIEQEEKDLEKLFDDMKV
jgi:hypothetical protein